MSRTLLILSIGPVQQFIGQSRRMRDLWFGSHLLSELARAAARDLAEVQEERWTLVFPALDAGDPALFPCDGTLKKDGSQPLGISNKIVAYRESASDEAVGLAVDSARSALLERWRALARHAVKRAGDLLAEGIGEHEHPEEVIESFLEVVAGWSRFDVEGDFDRARREAEQALAARKVLRDFTRWDGRPQRKSSLDGQRESILIPRRAAGGQVPTRIERKLRLPAREHLDGIGFVKRAAGEPEQFVPVARIAIEPWLQAVDHAAKADKRLYDAFSTLESACAEQRVPRSQRGVTRWLRSAFPYDGELFFEGQWPALGKELGIEALCEQHVRPLFRRPLSLPEPHPYVAALHADGDRMGQVLASLRTPSAQRRLCEALAGFSREVRGIVESHFGLHVYAGGDDLVAFLPVEHAFYCANELRSVFEAMVQTTVKESRDRDSDAPLPTLSVGIGVGHFLRPLGRLLDLARDAEQFAKRGEGLRDGDREQRNALGVILDKRSGATTRWRARWDDDPPPTERLAELKRLLVDGEMPAKLPYELRPVLDALAGCRDDDRGAARTWALECRRILGRKRGDGRADGLEPEQVGLNLPTRRDAEAKDLKDILGTWIGAATVARAWADAERNRSKVAGRGAGQESRDDD